MGSYMQYKHTHIHICTIFVNISWYKLCIMIIENASMLKYYDYLANKYACCRCDDNNNQHCTFVILSIITVINNIGNAFRFYHRIESNKNCQLLGFNFSLPVTS